jgi:hypothetical protein
LACALCLPGLLALNTVIINQPSFSSSLPATPNANGSSASPTDMSGRYLRVACQVHAYWWTWLSALSVFFLPRNTFARAVTGVQVGLAALCGYASIV